VRKFSLVFLLVFSLGFSAVRLQGQVSSLGYGAGLGLGMQVIPVLLEVGLEGSTHTWPVIKSKGEYQGVPYDGNISLSASRAGGYAKFTIPGLSLIPIVGLLAHPTIHAGTQSGVLSAGDAARLPGFGVPFSGNRKIEGSYALLGFPGYLLWFFIEPAIGTQHIYVPGVANISYTDVQLAIGASF
jgi:hypothetical protein